MPRLTVIAASTRPGRVGRQIADWFAALAIADDRFDVALVDLAELDLPFHDEPNQPSDGGPYLFEHTQRWSRIVEGSDAFVLVMPEYNRGYSAPLKNALDYLYLEWHHKPVGIVSYGMTSAGLRAAEMIKPVADRTENGDGRRGREHRVAPSPRRGRHAGADAHHGGGRDGHDGRATHPQLGARRPYFGWHA